MEKITIKIKTVNSAFEDMPEVEISRILHKLAEDTINYGIGNKKLLDINGNTVGSVEIE